MNAKQSEAHGQCWVGFVEHHGSGIALRGMNCTRFGGLGLD